MNKPRDLYKPQAKKGKTVGIRVQNAAYKFVLNNNEVEQAGILQLSLCFKWSKID